jgi:hemerythrin-like domain-containing protein
MNITDALLGEHAVFYALFTHLEQSVPTADKPALVKSQGAMLAAGLASHANLEEELLFKTLEKQIGSGGPLAVMRMEHEEIEQSLERLPGVEELDQARELLLHVVATAREHFAKEEKILFPLASQTLSHDTLSSLGDQWAAHRAIVLE